MHKVREFTQLSQEDRVKIEVLLHQGFSLSAIACELNRPVSTIWRECKRNTKDRTSYKALAAQQLCKKRHAQKPKHYVFSEQMKSFIAEKLVNQRLSPQLICLEGKRRFKDFISAEWVYQWIWGMKFSQRKQDRKYAYLYECLRQGVRKKSRGKKHCKRGRI